MSLSNRIPLKVNDGTSMQAYYSLPEGKGAYPGILLFQEAYGVNPHIRSVADRLANEGYVVIAPELFHRTAPAGFESGYTDFSAVAPHFQALTVNGFTADINAAYDWLQEQSNVQQNKIGSIGFCLGGRVSFLANALLPLAAAVSFYGGGTAGISDKAKDLYAPHLFFWGGLDKHITHEQVETVVNAVKAAGKEYVNVEISYADHGFFCDVRASYNPQAAKEAWAMTLAFFENKLKQ